MKKYLITPVLGLFLILLSSWGPEGHSITAQIAQNHLTPAAQSAVSTILGGQPMSSVSSWADQTKNTTTAPWHFLNLELGILTFADFSTTVKGQTTPNVYSEMQTLIAELKNPKTPAAKKQQDLKYIIHFVGDAHQPMHVSRKEDRGGNDIHLTYNKKATNLHSMWDGVMIQQDNRDVTQSVTKIDHSSKAQIDEWQKDDMLVWLYESYQISSKLYGEVKDGDTIGPDYFTNHINIVDDRLEKGGIRLAGVLNSIFK